VRTSKTVGECQLAWIAGRQFALRESSPVPLVVLGPQCAFRMEAIRRLDEKRIPWRLAAVSPSLAGLWATARGGLGITVRSTHDVPADLVAHATLFGLPKLDSFPITLHARAPIRNPCLKRLYEIVSVAIAESLAPVGDGRG
jgi:DNA-binding transcriptional LysR family regulator